MVRPGTSRGARLAGVPTRRAVLRSATAAAGACLSPWATVARAPLRLLLVGSTGFIGPQLVRAALAGGHRVTMLNRGRRTPAPGVADFSRVEALRGDRSHPDAYAALAGR
jgi:2'-hydroxyisoflavone reductase